jgi:hypothetical protein
MGVLIMDHLYVQGRLYWHFKNTHLKSVENITDGRFVPYITGCVVNFNINMK